MIDRPGWDSPVTELDRLRAPDGEPLTGEEHAGCPGHAAYVRRGRVQTVSGDSDSDTDSWALDWAPAFVCTDPAGYGHTDTNRSGAGGGELTDEQKADRRRVIANNKAWRSAEAVRRQWLADFLTRKTPPKGAVRYLLRTLAVAPWQLKAAMNGSHRSAMELLGIPVPEPAGIRSVQDTLLTEFDNASDGRAQMIALGLVLGAIEHSLDVMAWRRNDPAVTDYLTALTTWGYEPSDVEQLAAGSHPNQHEATGTEVSD